MMDAAIIVAVVSGATAIVSAAISFRAKVTVSKNHSKPFRECTQEHERIKCDIADHKIKIERDHEDLAELKTILKEFMAGSVRDDDFFKRTIESCQTDNTKNSNNIEKMSSKLFTHIDVMRDDIAKIKGRLKIND